MGSFPNVIFGDYGSERKTYSTKPGSLELGDMMIQRDGSVFAFCKAGGTALVAGQLYQQGTYASVCGSADAHAVIDLAVASGGVAGSSTVVLTMAGTAMTKDILAGGILFVSEATGYGTGVAHRIKSNSAASTVGALTVTIEDTFAVSLSAGTSKCGLRNPEYSNLILTTADTVGLGLLAGVAPSPVVASYYGWIQRKGRCACLTDGTVIIGEAVVQSSALAGAVCAHPANTASALTPKSINDIGWCLNVAASTKYSLIYLTLP